MAEFLEDSAGVFRGIDACLFDAAVGSQQSAVGSDERKRTVIVGCDIAKHTDWTVCIAMDAKTGLCLEIERIQPTRLACSTGEDCGVCESVAGPGL